MGVKIQYRVIELFPDSNKKVTIFYNEDRGVLAILDSDNLNQNLNITWLIGKCGLLASSKCLEAL